ncbi:MAG: hypothetical protein ACTSPS_07855 [Promethearchaeota archaeon]
MSIIFNSVDEEILKTIINSNSSIEEKLEKGLYFFHNNYDKYESPNCLNAIILFFKDVLFNLSPRDLALFFMDLFYLGAPEYSGTEKDKIYFVELPAITLKKLIDISFNTSKIIGGIIQFDHPNHLGYQLSQIFDYLFEKELIIKAKFIQILQNIITNEFASLMRVGRLLASFVHYNTFKISEVTEIIKEIRNSSQLGIDEVSELIIGFNSSINSDSAKIKIIRDVFILDKFNSNMMKDENIIRDPVIVIAKTLSNDLYNNFSANPIIEFIMSLEIERILAEALKYMRDSLMISLKRIVTILRKFIIYKRLEYNLIPKFISISFSKYEIAEFIVNFFKFEEIDLTKDEFSLFLSGFYNQQYHGFKNQDLKQIISHIRKIQPHFLNSMNIEDIDEFLNSI